MLDFIIKVRKYKVLICFIALHVIAWSLLPFTTRNILDSKLDMAENFVWGMNPQWGYYKHPPLFAFVSYNWLNFFGINDLSYFFLSQFNIAVGMVAIFFLARIFLSLEKSILAVCVLEFMLFYNVLGIKFNANSILLSLFPITSLFFVRAIKYDKLLDWLLCGIFAAFCILSKYYSVILLISFLCVTLFTGRFVSLIRSYKPYCSLLICITVLMPHIMWLIKTDFLAFGYINANMKIGFPLKPFAFIATNIFHILIVLFVLGPKSGIYKRSLKDENFIILLTLTFMPSLTTFILGIIFNLETSSVWGIPNWFALSILLLYIFDVSNLRRIVLQKVAILVNIIVIIFAILNYYFFHFIGKQYAYNAKNVVSISTSTWYKATNNLPVRYVTGDDVPAYYTSFYSHEHPKVLLNFDYEISPWIKKEDIEDHGMLIICETSNCVKQAKQFCYQCESYMEQGLTIFTLKPRI